VRDEPAKVGQEGDLLERDGAGAKEQVHELAVGCPCKPEREMVREVRW
jgi:hypothetical protein